MRDEGDTVPQPNGEVLEFGTMVNPESGREEGYVECWVDLEVGSIDLEGESQRGEMKSWVLRCESGYGEEGVRGLVVRVGTWIQGVVRSGEEVGVARWRWRDETGWERVVEIGVLDLPPDVFGEGEMKEGEKIEERDGLVWECVESFEWN